MKKILHRIFFNFDDKPDPFLSYLDTWKKELPDFEIMQWDKNNLPLELNEYTSYMAKTKNHAFLSDYFRCWLLKKYGGVYLDADIEILNGNIFRSIYEDMQSSEEHTFFIGIESTRTGSLTAHSMGIKYGETHEILNFLMYMYETVFTTSIRYIIKRFPITDLMSLYFCEWEENKHFNLSSNGFFPGKEEPFIIDSVKIFPQDYFSPVTEYNNRMMISSFSEHTCLCHHFAATWKDEHGGKKTGMLFSELLNKNYYVVPKSIVPKLEERYGKFKKKPNQPLWSLNHNEILKLEIVLNRLIPYDGRIYSFLRKKRKK